jgi:hypothetical protein
MNQNAGWNRLAQGRRAVLAVAAMALSVFLTGFSLNPFASSTPALMLLEHTQDGKPVQTRIEVKDGLVISPDKGKPRDKWIIRAGDALKSEVRPGDRSVGFYRGVDNQSTLLFVVKVHYYLNSDGRWVPQFQINEEPVVIRLNGRWQPLSTSQGIAGQIALTGTALPNAEGYFTSLEFGFTSGPASIDAWQVQ